MVEADTSRLANAPNKAVAALTTELVSSLARQAGFDEAGVVALPYAEEARDASRLAEWLRDGRAGTMHYLARTTGDGEPVRGRAASPFPWAHSAVVCLASYHAAEPRSTDPAEPGLGWIARYAWTGRREKDGSSRPSDYHKVLLKRLRVLETLLREHCGQFGARAFVDTGPLMERALAVAAGLGWVGRNTTLIHPRLGSYTFLAVLVTSLETRSQAELAPDRCGSCRRCLDACPTGALTSPHQMDARRCISYLTIEHRGPIEEHMEKMGRQVFGCDICQDVCPWNRKALVADDQDFKTRAELVNPALEWLGGLDEAAFERLANGSPLRRAGFDGLRRNVAIAMGNSGMREFRPLMKAWTRAADSGLRAAAHWALKQLRKNGRGIFGLKL
jgi:epoxyqueuosine reductase